MQALAPVLLRSLQVVPFVQDAGQAQMRFVDNLKRLITRPLQHTSVGLGRQIELVVYFLYDTEGDGRQDGGEDIPRCLAERYGFSQRLAGSGAVSLQEVSKPQRPASGRAGRQVVGAQILQGAARLGAHDLWLVASEGQGSPGAGNLSQQVSRLVVQLGALHGSLGRLEFLFHAGRVATDQ